MKRPILIPPCPGWKEDFNLPNAPTKVDPSPILLNSNHQDDIYLETPRNSVNTGGLLTLCIPLSITTIILGARIIATSIQHNDYESLLTISILISIITWQVAIYFRLVRTAPRDEPIRFNRARQKVYAYNFTFCWWNPFIPWPIKIVSYDWKDVRAERWRKQAVTHQGSHLVKTGIMLSVVEPGTNKVIDRFSLSNTYGEESIWAYICTYMQHGLDAVSPAPHNEDHNLLLWYQFAKRLAPEVKWPEAIDHESRTAPHTAPLKKVELP
ncbi:MULTISPECIES: DUF6708 domain-containing protein [Pseudomonas]|uniref:DUF6708 domain-containing protein n=1 Tax=Pseudomonas peradeniyensis TaxID=2745488 RepID=A0ABT2VIG0_9PSED|nr:MULTISPECIES: DUF6708 domain-containing protein [Pseudomonas]MCU7241517.1 hypothetical protein [Pseudomonas peradeniyensis]MDN4500737.1 hypothetical protein [Pseudomonas mosselii]